MKTIEDIEIMDKSIVLGVFANPTYLSIRDKGAVPY